jgi:hypothetical protein
LLAGATALIKGYFAYARSGIAVSEIGQRGEEVNNTPAQGEADDFPEMAAELRAIRAGGSVRGCTDEDILAVKAHWGGKMPRSCESFLRTMGAEAGPLWRDSYHFVPHVLELDLGWLHDLASELGVSLPAGEVLLINAHDGYEFQWLLLGEDQRDDPPVWQLLETVQPQLKCVAQKYTDYVAEAISSVASFYATHPDFDLWNSQWP